MKLIFFTLLAAICGQLYGVSTKTETIFINRGQIEAVDSSLFAYLAFNQTPAFDKSNVLIRIGLGDSLILTVINNDTVNHIFSCQSKIAASSPILPGDTGIFKFLFSSTGAFIYHDANPLMTYLGLGGIISVENNTHAHYFWNIKEHNKKWNDTIANGYPVNWNNYYPDYFLINGNSNPHINNDSVARVTGNVGDTIYIVMANTGRSIHSLHFHGYHATVVYSSKYPQQHGRSKDTFPLLPMETLIVELIPDKPGEYPVHDHNLVAVSGGNYYPNGMFLTLLIQ